MESRDGTLSKDPLVQNGIVEARGDSRIIRKRPGMSDAGLVHAATAQLLYSWNGVNAILGDTLYRGTTSTIVSSPTTTALSPTNASQRFDAQEVGASAGTQLLMIKNRTQAWTVTRGGVASAVSFASAMGASTYAVTSLTRVSGTATAVLASDPGFNVGDTVTIAGATPGAYNGAQTVLTVTPYSFTPAHNVSISSLTRSGTTATAQTATAHGLSSGTYTISGAGQSAYNGSKSITVTDTTHFTYTVSVTTYSTAYGSGVALSTTDKDSHIALSGGNLTATATLTSGHAAIRADTGKSSGSFIWEVTVPASANIGVGVANSSFSLTTDVGFSANSWGTYNTYFASTVLGFRLDMSAGTLAIYRDGVFYTEYSGITGTVYPAFSAAWVGGTTTVAVTFNFGATAFSYAYVEPTSPATGSPILTVAAVTVDAAFTFAIGGSPATPATGTITAQGSGGMVPGLPYIDGWFVVMDTNGVMWHSALDDPTSWPALNNLTAQNENGGGRALAKLVNYLVALKEWSTEFFVDAKFQTGFVFSPVDGGFSNIGCASGDSLAKFEGMLAWVGQTREQGRGVYALSGLQPPQKISSPDVDRILNGDSLVTVYAYGLKLDGHSLYLLTLPDTGITLVYDFAAQSWTTWTFLTIGSSVPVTSITLSGTVATVLCASAHGLSDGDPVSMGGAAQTAYNGIFQAGVIDSTSYTVEVRGSPATATGSITATPYTSSYFPFARYADIQGLNLLLHKSNGHLYQVDSSLYQDGGVPIDLFIRTARLDGGSDATKRMPRLVIVADNVTDSLMVRHSDDDSQTFSSYRRVDLDFNRPVLRRLGSFRRRTIEIRHTGNTAPRIEALELEVA